MKVKFWAPLVAAAVILSACTPSPKTEPERDSYSIGVQLGNSLVKYKDRFIIKSVKDGLADKLNGATARLSDQDMGQALQALGNQSAVPDDSSRDKTGYAIGQRIGANLVQYKDYLDIPQLQYGITDKLNGGSLKMQDDEMQTVLQSFQMKMNGLIGAKNEKDGEAFLEQNLKNPGVKVTKSGLQYQVLVQGHGRKPTANSTVTVNYEGKLIDGSVFDSSYTRGQPAQFKVNGVIPGWTEALEMMPQGSKWHIVLPGKIAYGAQGAGGQIGPNAVLQFDVELLAIK